MQIRCSGLASCCCLHDMSAELLLTGSCTYISCYSRQYLTISPNSTSHVIRRHSRKHLQLISNLTSIMSACVKPSSTTLSKTSSSGSLRSTCSMSRAGYSHPLYRARSEKHEAVTITTIEVEESRFSSCSTSPNSSSESLNALSIPISSQLSELPFLLPTAVSGRGSTHSLRSASQASSRYADDHYPLINTVETSKPAISSILDMAHAYNTYIRAINSCHNHANTIGTDEVAGFLFFNQTLYNILSQHLKSDQEYLQRLVRNPLVLSQIFGNSISIHDDRTFQTSFHAWGQYIHDPHVHRKFSHSALQAHISAFGSRLVQHLHDEVFQLSALVDEEVLLPEHLSHIWTKFEKTLSAKLDMWTDKALLVGCQDRHFSVNGQRREQNFPRLPLGTATMVRLWHSRRHSGAWMRYCSSDFSGKRRVVRT